MDSLALLPIWNINDSMAYLKKIVLGEAETWLNYFDRAYINGKYRQVKKFST